jgi:hypothetical protein
MDPLERIAERKLKEAVDEGLLDDYPGKGEPMALEDLSGMDADARLAYILLKGHGYVSEEHALHREIVSVHSLLAACRDDQRSQELGREARAERGSDICSAARRSARDHRATAPRE